MMSHFDTDKNTVRGREIKNMSGMKLIRNWLKIKLTFLKNKKN